MAVWQTDWLTNWLNSQSTDFEWSAHVNGEFPDLTTAAPNRPENKSDDQVVNQLLLIVSIYFLHSLSGNINPELRYIL